VSALGNRLARSRTPGAKSGLQRLTH
jgi:hypothetical protein